MAKRSWAIADCETDPFKFNTEIKPFVWGFYDGVVYYEFAKTEDFIKHVSEQEIILYAHNGGKFDWHFIKEYIPPEQKIMIINGRIASFKIGKCEFRDSYNFLPIPLAAYQKTEIDYDIFTKEKRENPENKKKISAYLKDDCLFLFELVEKFISDYGINLTLAGAAMKFWRKKFYKGKPVESTRFFFEQISPFYYGGRVECFKKGIINNDFFMYDINSAYPYAMKHLHPWGTQIEVLDKLPRHYERCFITIACVSNGAFPFRDKTGLSFPSDNEKRIYTITGWELKAAKELNLIKKAEILKVYKFAECIDFEGYVNHFFEEKKKYKNTDTGRYIISKTMMNSLYGKFAANPENYKEYYTIKAEEILTYQEHTQFDYTAMLSENVAIVEKPLPEEKQHYYNIATAASITGFVRAYLLKALKSTENLYYCDTDCIVGSGKIDIKVGKELGEWEKEGEYIKGAIAGKKLYAFIGKDGKIKKASKGAKLSEKDIFAVAKGEKVVYNSEAPTFSIKGVNYITRIIQKT